MDCPLTASLSVGLELLGSGMDTQNGFVRLVKC
jgi:hypothetical protein